MAQIRVPVEELPPPDENGDHALQFRIISIDKNQRSTWSQLYIIKSIGQYRPKLSPVSASILNNVMTINWNSPLVYNVSNSLPSASIQHTRPLSSKFIDTDIFVQFSSGSAMTSFGYLSRVSNDTARVLIPSTSASVRVVGTLATKNIPQPYPQESLAAYQERFDDYLGISASVQGVFDLFRVFDTGISALPTSSGSEPSSSTPVPISVSDSDEVGGFAISTWSV
jgi:hypothetical protein